MSKKFKGKKCVYCTKGISITGDHVFAREFLPKNQRDNTPKVPACVECNNKKSKIEHYLTTVLPFGGMHAQAKKNLVTMVPKRLSKNKKLHEALRKGTAYLHDKGMKKMGIPIEGESVLELFKYITKGLSWYHWNTLIENTSFIFSTALSRAGEKFFDEYYFSLNSKNRIENSIGQNSFAYIGVQAVDTDQITVWKFKIYNGITMIERGALNVSSNCVGVITGPLDLKNKVISAFNTSKTA